MEDEWLESLPVEHVDAVLQAAALNELYGLGFDHHEKMLAEIESTSIERVKEVGRRYFHEQARVLVTVGPEE